MPDADTPVLEHAQLVPGRLVHRRSLSDVLVTEAHDTGDDTFLAGVQWPRNHRLFGRSEQIDVSLVAETVRQLTIYVAHTRFDVPLGHAFLMGAMCATAIDRPMDGVRPELAVAMRASDVRRSARGVTSFGVEATVTDPGGPVARGSAHARIVDPSTYARTRRGRTPPPAVAGPTRGRGLELLDPSGHPGVSTLVVDTAETTLFDHPLDHVPGMLLIEAARQAVRACGGPVLTTVDAVFDAVVELDEPCAVVVDQPGDDWRVRFEQGGRTRTTLIGRAGAGVGETGSWAERPVASMARLGLSVG